MRDLHHSIASESDQTERLAHRAVGVLSDHHGDWWCAEQTVALRIPPCPLEEFVTCCRHARRVGDRGAGDESDVCVAGQPEDVEQPASSDVVQLRRRRGHHGQRGVLIPCIDQECGAQSDGERGAVDKAEVVRPRRHHRRWVGHFAQQSKCVGWIRRPVGERLVERIESGQRCSVGRRRPTVCTRHVLNRQTGGFVQQLDVVHRAILTRRSVAALYRLT